MISGCVRGDAGRFGWFRLVSGGFGWVRMVSSGFGFYQLQFVDTGNWLKI